MGSPAGLWRPCLWVFIGIVGLQRLQQQPHLGSAAEELQELPLEDGARGRAPAVDRVLRTGAVHSRL